MSAGDAPPHDLEAEMAVLGAVLLSGGAVDALVEEGLRAEDFYRLSHGTIFAAMLAMREAGTPIDRVTLRDHLRQGDVLAVVGGEAALDLLEAGVPAVGAHRAYARIVVRKAMHRVRLRFAHQQVELARAERDEEYRELLAELRKSELHYRALVERGEVRTA